MKKLGKYKLDGDKSIDGFYYQMVDNIRYSEGKVYIPVNYFQNEIDTTPNYQRTYEFEIGNVTDHTWNDCEIKIDNYHK